MHRDDYDRERDDELDRHYEEQPDDEDAMAHFEPSGEKPPTYVEG